MSEQIRRLSALFNGLARAHGKYYIGEPDPETGKMQGKGLTVREPWTDEDWQNHLDGKVGLGIVPFDESGTCNFGTIDIDDYNVDFDAIAKTLADLNVPHVLLESKSLGAHVCVPLRLREEAKWFRGFLRDLSVMLGYPNAEVFPKQDKPASENDVGNWINMPYFGDTRKMRGGHDLNYFLTYAESIATTRKELEALNLAEKIDQDPKNTYPPCMLTIMENGIGAGGRNKTLFNFGVLLKKVHGEDADQHIIEANQKYLSPPLPAQEVASIIASTGRRDYFYTCDDEPLCGVCDKKVCRTRKYGIGRGDGAECPIDELVKYDTDPVLWYVGIGGQRVELTTPELHRYHLIQQRVAEVLTMHIPSMKNGDWMAVLAGLMQNVEVVHFSDDAGDFGAFKQHLHEFLTSSPSTERSDLLNGTPVKQEGDVYLFRLPDLMDYLRNKRFTRYVQAHVAARLHQLDATSHEGSIKGSSVRWWSIKQFYKPQDEEFDVPEIEGVPLQ